MRALCLSTYSTTFTNFDLARRIMDCMPPKKAGIDFWLVNADDAYFDRIRSEAAGEMAPFYRTLHSTAKTTELSSAPGSEQWRQSLAVYQKNFALYRDIGAHSIVLHTNQREIPPEEAPRLRKNVIANIHTLADIAAPQGIQLLIENVGPISKQKNLFDQAAFIDLFHQLPASVGCLIDTGHAFLNGWDLPEVIVRLKDRIQGYHLNSNDGSHDEDAHRPLFIETHFYDAAHWRDLLRLMERETPDADWILEYSAGEHINPTDMKEEIRQILACVES